jgi:hypothetical protein
MKRFVKFLNLTPDERGLLIGALFHLAAIRIGLWVLPLQVMLRQSKTLKVFETFRVSRLPAERIAWAIRVVSRYLPGTRNCLVQSLAAQTLLARRGYSTQLRIGVAKDEGGQFKAHAWVECDGQIIIGAAGVSQFTALPPLEFQRP